VIIQLQGPFQDDWLLIRDSVGSFYCAIQFNPLTGMANLSTHHMVSTTEGTETWNSSIYLNIQPFSKSYYNFHFLYPGLNFSTQECQMNYNLSNNQTKQQNSQTKDGFTTYYVLSSGELSSSSTESQVKKKEMQERRRKKKEKKLVREERRRKKEEKRKKEERRRKEEKRRKKEGRRRKVCYK
jgi:hypothetical protein